MNRRNYLDDAERIVSDIFYDLNQREDGFYQELLTVQDIVAKRLEDIDENEWEQVCDAVLRTIDDIER